MSGPACVYAVSAPVRSPRYKHINGVVRAEKTLAILFRRVADLGLKLRRQALPERRQTRRVEPDMQAGLTENRRTDAERQRMTHAIHHRKCIFGEAPGLAVPAGRQCKRRRSFQEVPPAQWAAEPRGAQVEADKTLADKGELAGLENPTCR
jgi:hypothetical protein